MSVATIQHAVPVTQWNNLRLAGASEDWLRLVVEGGEVVGEAGSIVLTLNFASKNFVDEGVTQVKIGLNSPNADQSSHSALPPPPPGSTTRTYQHGIAHTRPRLVAGENPTYTVSFEAKAAGTMRFAIDLDCAEFVEPLVVTVDRVVAAQV